MLRRAYERTRTADLISSYECDGHYLSAAEGITS
jgi:hypothetical protein